MPRLALLCSLLAAGSASELPPALPPPTVAAGALPPPSPPPSPSATVGSVRVQALAPDLIRVERRGPRGFEDAPTFLAQRRDLSPAGASTAVGAPSVVGSDGSFNVTVGDGDGALVVHVQPAPRAAARCFAMANVNLFPVHAAAPAVHAADEGACCDACDANENCTSWLYSGSPAALYSGPPPPPPPPPVSCCDTGSQLRDTDVSGPRLIKPARPGQCNATLTSCCKMCDASTQCRAFVLAPPSSWSACPEQPYCFLLEGYAATKHKAGSIVGQKGGGPGPAPPRPHLPPQPPPPPGRRPNCKLNRGYGEQSLGGATFGCPRRGCDATWSGRWQGGDLGQKFRQPALGLWASVHRAADGVVLGSSDDASAPFNFPAPSDPLFTDRQGGVFALRDSPRFLVPEGGAVPQPFANLDPALKNTSGYDIRNDADDVYLFVARRGNDSYTRLTANFLKLTGPVPLLPDYAFGTWFTEWHNYSQAVAEAEIMRWRTSKLPLSVWGLDINWRNNDFGCNKGGNCCEPQLPGESCEYYYNQTNTSRLPNITDLFRFEHAQVSKPIRMQTPVKVRAAFCYASATMRMAEVCVVECDRRACVSTSTTIRMASHPRLRRRKSASAGKDSPPIWTRAWTIGGTTPTGT